MNNHLIVSPENEQTALTVVSKDTQQYLSVSTEHDVSVVSDREQRADIQPSKDTALLMVPVQTVKQDLITKTDCIVYVPLATKNSYGIVKPGEGLVIQNGVLSTKYSGDGSGVTENYVQVAIEEHNYDDLAHPYIQDKLISIEALIKERGQAISYLNYKDMVDAFNTFLSDSYVIGQSVYIGTRDVPDLWIYKVSDYYREYIYTTDSDIINAINDVGYIQIGYYLLSPLETGKTVVGNYVTVDTIQTVSGIKTFTEMIGLLNYEAGEADYIKHINNNFLISSHDGKSLLNIDEQLEKIYSFNKELANKDFIKNSYLSFTESQTLTEEQQAFVRSKIGAGSGSFSGAYNDLSGVPTLNTNNSDTLTVGSESVKDTINLHKVSKTGLLSDLKEDDNHQLVTKADKTKWNGYSSDLLKIEGDIKTANLSITLLSDSYNDLYKAISSKASQSELNSVASSLADLSETVDVLDGNIGDVHIIVNEHTQDISSLKTKNTQQDTNITNLSNDLSTTNTNVTNLTNRVTTIEQVNGLQDEVITLLANNKVDKVEGKGLSTNDYTNEDKSKLENLKNYDDTEIRNLINDKYTKPENGIPKTDLSSDIQVSLEKADSALPNTTKYAYRLEIYQETTDVAKHLYRFRLKDQDGNTMGIVQHIDLPLESVVVSGSYDKTTKEVVLTLENGSVVRFSVADLVSGLASQSDLDDLEVRVESLETRVLNIETKNTEQDNAISKLNIDKADKNAIPTVNDGALTIQKNGMNVATFSANQSENVIANIPIPTTLAELDQDDTHQIVTVSQKNLWNKKVSQDELTNAITPLQNNKADITGYTILEYSTGLTDADLNDYFGDDKLGYYHWLGSGTVLNLPENVSTFSLHIKKALDNMYLQELTRISYSKVENGTVIEYEKNVMFSRVYINGSWTTWKQNAYIDDIPNNITPDTELSTTSENPIQNKVITNALNETNAEVSNIEERVNVTEASISSNYQSITGLTENVNNLSSDVNTLKNAGYLTLEEGEKHFSDITVIKVNGEELTKNPNATPSDIDAYGSNVNIKVPTKTSELTNDSDFVREENLPDFSNFVTEDDLPNFSDFLTENEGNNNYAKREEGVYYVEGSDITAAGTWEGTNDRIESYYNGLTINFKIGVAGGTSTTGTTLNINGLGAKMCYMRGTSKITTHYAVGTTVLLTYSSSADDGNGGFYSSDYDANTNVTQTVRTTNGNFPLLLRGTSAGTTTTTTTTTFGTKFTANPSTGELKATKFTENGTTLASKYLGINANAVSATKATQDGDGNVISTTYAKKTELPEGATVDSTLSTTSTNAVQNKVITAELNKKVEFEDFEEVTVTPSMQTQINDLQTGKANVNLANANPTLIGFSFTAAGKSGTKYTGAHIIVESWKASDNSMWYRKWSDGWKEVGGWTSKTSSSGTWTVDLPVEFSNKTYVSLAGVVNSTDTFYDITVTKMSVSQIKLYCADSRTGFTFDYYCCGY